MTRRRILVPFGTRPEVIKLAPVVHALRAAGHEVITIDTGQHQDAAMSGDVQRDLGLVPDVRLPKPDGLGGLVTAALATIATHPADLVLALGDTHTVPAYALAARNAGLPFAHLEAGLRSFNPRSAEEVNRRVAAATAQLHFAPTTRAAAFLHDEGVPAERVFVVGNPVIDTLRAKGVTPVPPSERSGVLVTAHRASNVDDPARLARLVDVVGRLAAIGPVRFPVHPRTRARLQEHGLAARLAALPGVTCEEPLPYDDLLAALANARVVVTDSGGLQEEAAYLGVPVVVLRRSTPRWEGVEAGTAVLTGITSDDEADRAVAAAHRLSTPSELARVAALPCPYGDGRTGARVAALLADPALNRLLALDEPDHTDGTLPWTTTPGPEVLPPVRPAPSRPGRTTFSLPAQAAPSFPLRAAPSFPLRLPYEC
ncbi:UDP-N-acetylglucosamine 2-epimerase (non-hydrolyzing) [Actinoplanes sp. NPDC023801]|uniref:non-hydrolyzing UDP-N-acetylglucosamine 2-epimerase n=1 Tax=Actinoplanes sp. NPDC023801 TaxID=3154595 RepID=UPI0033E34133